MSSLVCAYCKTWDDDPCTCDPNPTKRKIYEIAARLKRHISMNWGDWEGRRIQHLLWKLELWGRGLQPDE